MGIKNPLGLFTGVNGYLGVLGQNSVLTLIKYLSHSSAEWSPLEKESWELWKFQMECFEINQGERSQTHIAIKNRVAAPKMPLRNPILPPPESPPSIAHGTVLWPRLFGHGEDDRLVVCSHPSTKVTSGDNYELHCVGVLPIALSCPLTLALQALHLPLHQNVMARQNTPRS